MKWIDIGPGFRATGAPQQKIKKPLVSLAVSVKRKTEKTGRAATRLWPPSKL